MNWILKKRISLANYNLKKKKSTFCSKEKYLFGNILTQLMLKIIYYALIPLLFVSAVQHMMWFYIVSCKTLSAFRSTEQFLYV